MGFGGTRGQGPLPTLDLFASCFLWIPPLLCLPWAGGRKERKSGLFSSLLTCGRAVTMETRRP